MSHRSRRGDTRSRADADADVSMTAAPTPTPIPTPTTPAKRFYRNKRGVKVFSNAVPRGAMGKNKAQDDDSRAASRAAPELAPLDACAAEFHPAPPQGSYRDAAAPAIAPSVARGDTPSGPLSNADSSGETSEDGDATHGANESAGAGDDNNARAVDEAQWPSLRQASRRTAREPVAAAADDDDDAEDEDVEESWRCDECHQRNRPARADCRRCGIARVTLDESSHSPPRRTVPPPTPPAGPPPPLTVIRRAMERRDEHPPSAASPPPSLERQGSLLRTLLPNLPEDSHGDDDVDDLEVVSKEPSNDAWADERADDLPSLPPSFANAPDAIAADVAVDVADDVADDAESAAESPAAGMHRDFGEGFDAPVDVAPPPGFLHADADAAPVESASVVAFAALQAALAAERAARDAADAARPLVRTRPSGPASASDDKRTASILSRMDATMDSRLALLERCIVGQLEGLRSEVEAGARERAELRARLERLEGQRASGEMIAKKNEYSCPPSGDGRRPASPPPAPRLERGRPPPIAIDVEDVHDDAREDPRRIEREPRRIERDDDADDVVEEDDDDVEPEHPGDIPREVHRDEEVQPPGTFQPVVGRASPRGESDALADDAAEFEATLAGFRSMAPAPLAANPFEGLATSLPDDEDDLPDDEASKPGTFQKPPEHRTGRGDGEKARPLPGRRANPANPAPRAPDPTPREETVEEALAAIALEEEQRAARQRAGGKRGSRKGSRKGNGTDRRQALVDAYLELSKRKATAKGEGEGEGEKLSRRKAVRWADETVPSAAVTGERIRAFVRATTTTALGARLADVFGGDSFGGTRLG